MVSDPLFPNNPLKFSLEKNINVARDLKKKKKLYPSYKLNFFKSPLLVKSGVVFVPLVLP